MAVNVISVQETPNPNARKFVVDQALSPVPASFFNAAAAETHPLAKALFEVPEVGSVLILNDFVTVNKKSEGVWSKITPRVKKILRDFHPR